MENETEISVGGEDPEEQSQRPTGGVRKRTRRACDRCSSLRVRCDGRQPCRRCEEYDQSCRYARSIGKRGRKPGSRKAPAAARDENQYSDSSEADRDQEEDQHPLPRGQPSSDQDPRLYRPASDPVNPHYASLPDHAPGARAPPSHHHQSRAQIPTQTLGRQYPASLHTLSHSSGQEPHGGADARDDLVLPVEAVGSPGLRRDRVSSFSRSHARNSPSVEPHTHTPSLSLSQNDGTSYRRFKCLEPILPILHGVVDTELACELLEMYFVEPGGSLFRCASPYVLTRVLRKESLLRPENPRRTTPALLTTMLWVSAQTAESSLFLFPGQKARVCEGLRKLVLALIHERDRDSWHRTTAGLLLKEPEGSRTSSAPGLNGFTGGDPRAGPEPPPGPLVDDVLTFVLLTIVTSGGDFKTDCGRWWDKALRLARSMGLNREDGPVDSALVTACTRSPMCECRACNATRACISVPEAQEERRRVFWLLFCLDRHLALSFNSPLHILDDECEIYCPLAEDLWQSSSSPLQLVPDATSRTYGAPSTVSGTGFFEWFLPLMTILGDVIQLHRRKNHPRFGSGRLEDEHDTATTLVEGYMADCARSISDMAARYEVDALEGAVVPGSQVMTPTSGVSPEDMGGPLPPPGPMAAGTSETGGDPADTSSAAPDQGSAHSSRRRTTRRHAQAQLVTAYSTFILHVLHVLLHGKWDAVSMLENKDGWISSVGFMKCASHSIAASDAVSRILACDPELTFMPYLFGIYLLHGSFILLLFADRMPQVGLNESVERACEIIIRAHEVCVVTLSTEFQKRFRKVLRSTLYSVRSAGAPNIEESKARRRALSLYRWSNGLTGLAL